REEREAGARRRHGEEGSARSSPRGGVHDGTKRGQSGTPRGNSTSAKPRPGSRSKRRSPAIQPAGGGCGAKKGMRAQRRLALASQRPAISRQVARSSSSSPSRRTSPRATVVDASGAVVAAPPRRPEPHASIVDIHGQ